MSERQVARKVKAEQMAPKVVAYADGLIALGIALKNPKSGIRELARLSQAVGLRLEFALVPTLSPRQAGKP